MEREEELDLDAGDHQKKPAHLARRQRVHDSAGESRRLSEPHPARGGAGSNCARPPTASISIRPTAAPSRWSIISFRTFSSATATRTRSKKSHPSFMGRRESREVLTGHNRGRYDLDHERSGDVILVSTPNSWQAYYWCCTTSGRRPSRGPSISIASRATIRWSCT